jgi:hypothetical protein
MGLIGDKAHEATEKRIFMKGGYSALWKYRVVRVYHKVTTCSCCS